ncbi:MAG TPA: ComF family protein [Gammaproteobacteria bacterium]|nr:ComF family protein [Gammaproteobacteria bacterium]
MFEKFIEIVHQVYSWILPFTCISCERLADRPQDLCSACLKDLPILTQSCMSCGAEIFSTELCGPCTLAPPAFSACYSLFEYRPPVTYMIHDLKFKHQLANARILGELMAEKIRTDWYYNKPLPELLVPVPLHPQRLKERGFNQALEIARPISKRLQISLVSQAVTRIKNTSAQMNLDIPHRKQNIAKAFSLRQNVKNKHIAVIDDVMTTGHTVKELTKTLLQGGAHKVEIWCVARTKKLN